MLTKGFLRTVFSHLVIAVASSCASTSFSCAQTSQSNVIVPPLGTPFYDYPPRAYPLAPAPASTVVRPYPYAVGFDQQFGPPVPYPSMMYPVDPYWVRRPTSFDVVVPADYSTRGFDPRAYDSQAYDSRAYDSGVSYGQAVNYVPMAAPLPIGNLRMTVGEGFLNRLIARNEQKPGEVRDFILGAEVTGHQTTETHLRLDLYPSADKVLGAFVMQGVTNSQTTGVTSQAMIDTVSRQRFTATKDIIFDGTHFSTRHAVVQVQASNQTLGATTALSGTLIGGIADRIAYRVAERRKPEAEAIARDRLVERVYPEFDNEIDRQLGKANGMLESSVRRSLRSMNLMPNQQSVSSTDMTMTYSAQIGADRPDASSLPPESQVVKADGIQLSLHESFLNSLIGSVGLKGLKTTDKQIKALFSPYEVASSATEVEREKPAIALPGMDNIVTDIEFDEVDPLTIQLGRDVASVTLRAKFKPAGQDLLPDLSVTVEYRTEIVDSKIIVTPGKVKVALQNEGDDNTSSGIALKVITQAVEASVSTLAFDRAVPASLWSYGGVVPMVTGIRSQDGWSTLFIE